MRARGWWGLLLGATVSGLGVAGWRLYQGRELHRVTGREGIDDRHIAAGFMKVARLPQMRLMRAFVIRRALALAPWGEGRTLEAVDLGCGPGYGAIGLARAAAGLHVTGIDLSNPLLAEAIRSAAGQGLSHRVEFRTADAAATPFATESVDLVVSQLSLHHWADPVAVLDEVHRILRPGGAFFIFDLRRDMAPLPWLLVWFATRYIVPAALRRAGEPMGSRNAAYTALEAAGLAQQSDLIGWYVARGPFWLAIEGREL